ncbi:cis-Golgi t-SNARE syntaxin [Actinomortierella ambigua]|nr:cis-Golgi t-SNARE syntaxin [Actinomortierella ambigua]
MDRTAEFKAEVNLLARSQGGMLPRNGSNQARQRRNNDKNIVAFLEFSQLARMIGKDISDTHGKLQKLKTCKCFALLPSSFESTSNFASLVNRKSLFDDRPVEISELTHSIKQDLTRLNAQTRSLQQHVRAAAAKGNRSTRQIDEHSGNLIIILQSKLANISMGFKEALEARSASVEASKKRQEQLLSVSTGNSQPPSLSPSQSGSSLSLRSSPIPHHLQANPLHQHLQNGGTHGRSASPFLVPAARASPPAAHMISEDGSSTMYSSGNIHRRKAANYRSADPNGGGYEDDTDASGPASMLYHQQQYAPQDQAQNRNAAIEAVESTLQELGGIFQQLAQMVAEQRETVQRIEANTEDIEVNISEAQTQLLRYYRNISSDRWMMIKIFLTIIFVFLVVSLVS